MDELTEEFFQLKLVLSPILAFIDEIKGVRRVRHISEESSLTIMGLLKLDIKEDLITTVRAMQVEGEKRIEEVEDHLRDTQKEMRDKFYDYSQSVTNLEMDLQNLGDLISRQGSFLEGQTRNFDTIKKDIGDKATLKDLLEVKKSMKHYAQLSDFNTLSDQVSECSTKASVDIIRKDLHGLEKRVKNYTTSNELNEAISASNDSMRKFLYENFISTFNFDEEKKYNEKRFDRTEEDMRILYQKNDLVNDAIKKKFKEVFELIKKKPWDPDIVFLQNQIAECSSKVEFSELQKFVTPKIESFNKSVIEAIESVHMFEKVLERYDEILLDKASKDDIGIINSKLPSFTSLNMFKELSSSVKKQAEENFDKIKLITSKLEDSQQTINNLALKIELIRRENLEVASIASTLTGITEKISEKADKSDIYLVYDVMGRKEEIQGIKEFDSLMKKQLEANVVIVHSLCRTMLKSGESPAVTRKQRYDLYRNLTNLIGWINGEEIKEPHITPNSKSPVNLKTDFDLETYSDLLASARLTKRTRRNIMTTSPRNKTFTDFVSFPPIV